MDKFTKAAGELESGLEYKVIKHILNSAGIERFAAYQMDMVRLGIGLYGVSASGQKGLRNVSTLKTTILQIQNVPAGDSIGYSRMSYVKRDSRIAIIPIGYADGLDRHFSNGGGEVLINGQRQLHPLHRGPSGLRTQHLHGRLHDRRHRHPCARRRRRNYFRRRTTGERTFG